MLDRLDARYWILDNLDSFERFNEFKRLLLNQQFFFSAMSLVSNVASFDRLDKLDKFKKFKRLLLHQQTLIERIELF